MMNSNAKKVEVYYSTQDWAIIKGNPIADPAFDTEYFFVWIGENKLDPGFIEAALKLNGEAQKKIDVVVGCLVRFETHPNPGFVIRTRSTWDFQSPSEAANTLEKLVWEVTRLIGS